MLQRGGVPGPDDRGRAAGGLRTDAAWASAWPCRARSGCATVSSGSHPTSAGSNAPFTAALSSRLGMTVVCDNDAHLGARAEHLRGVAVGRDNIAYLAGSVGVGGGFIVGGQPLTGASGYAGEIGHLSLDPDGPECRCGNTGCFETKISENRLLTLAGRLPGGGPEAVQEVIGAACRRRGAGVRGARRHHRLARARSSGGRQHLQPGDGRPRRLPRTDLAGPRRPRSPRGWASCRSSRPSTSVEIVASRFGHDAPLVGAAELAFTGLLADPASVSP